MPSAAGGSPRVAAFQTPDEPEAASELSVGLRYPPLAQVDPAIRLGADSSQFMPPFLNSRRGDEHVARGSRRRLKLRITKPLRVVVSTR